MAKPRPLRNAPIVEALVDFRVPPNPDVNEASFQDLRAALAPNFPKDEAKKRRDAQIRVGANGQLETNVTELGFHGLFLTSADQRTVIQFRPDGFTFSRLKPYTSWPEIREQAFAYWGMYVDAARPQTLVRVALRYINRMVIPMTHGADFDSYLAAAPVVPPALPQLVGYFLTTIVLHEPKQQLQANVTQSLEQSTGETMQVLFDIDAYRQHDFPVTGDNVRDVFEALHAFKNAIFFESLTEAALEAFD